MESNDKEILLKLIEKYGNSHINQIIKQEKIKSDKLKRLFLRYMYTTNIDPKTGEYVCPCYKIVLCSGEHFSNGISSSFVILDKPIILESWLQPKYKIVSMPIAFSYSTSMEIEEKVEDLVYGNFSYINLETLTKLVTEEEVFSLEELYLAKEIFKKFKVLKSNSTPAFILDSDKGRAYILGKDKNGRLTI